MEHAVCSDCYYCKTERKTEQGQVRCTRFSVFVKPSDNCDVYITKEMQELIERLRGKEI